MSLYISAALHHTSGHTMESGDVHQGVLLSMNVSGSGKKKPTVSIAINAVLEMYEQAKQQGTPPGAILLQEYSWADKSAEPLVEKLFVASGGAEWHMCRQWSDVRDTLILYNTCIYNGKMINGQYLDQTSQSLELNKKIMKLPPHIREVISSYKTRWAGVQLSALDPTKNHNPSRLQFLLVSYHGRDNQPGNTKINSRVKEILAQDFVAEVARAGTKSHFMFGVHPNSAACKCVPALIAGDWNIDIDDAFSNFDSLSYGTYQWTCSHHQPDRPFEGEYVRAFKDDIDYAVAVNHKHEHELSCDVSVTAVTALAHSKTFSQEGFDHDPIIVQFTVAPRYASSSNSSSSPLKRAAAAVAEEKIHMQLTGRPNGRQLQTQAREKPPPFHNVSPRTISTAGSETASLAVVEEESSVRATTTVGTSSIPTTTKGATKKGRGRPAKQKPAIVAVNPTEAKLDVDASFNTAPLVLHRFPAKYSLTKPPEQSYRKLKPLIKACKAMALDALGIQNKRGHSITNYNVACKQAWWPAGITKLAEFHGLTETDAKKLYLDLQAFLIINTTPAEKMSLPLPTIVPASSQGNVVGAGSLLKRALVKSLSGLKPKSNKHVMASEP